MQVNSVDLVILIPQCPLVYLHCESCTRIVPILPEFSYNSGFTRTSAGSVMCGALSSPWSANTAATERIEQRAAERRTAGCQRQPKALRRKRVANCHKDSMHFSRKKCLAGLRHLRSENLFAGLSDRKNTHASGLADIVRSAYGSNWVPTPEGVRAQNDGRGSIGSGGSAGTIPSDRARPGHPGGN